MKKRTPPKVFLSGRVESFWQDNVITEVPDLEYFDPRSHKLASPIQYTTWDMHHVLSADILFGYMEKDNPSGYGLATEVGYAKGSGKTVILVDEKSPTNSKFLQHFAIVRATADIVFDTLEEGIEFLRKFAIMETFNGKNRIKR